MSRLEKLRPVHVSNLGVIRRIHLEAGGDDAETFARLFEDDRIVDDGTVEGRLAAILEATEHRWVPGIHTPLDVPGLYEVKGFSDRGFRAAFRDPWPHSREQIGHILTAVVLALDPGRLAERRFGLRLRDLAGAATDETNEGVAIRLAIGHEKEPDPGRFDLLMIFKLRRQYRSASDEDVAAFRQALAALGDGPRLALDRAAPHLATIGVGDGAGNSIEDLNLSLAGYRLAQLFAARSFAARQDVATWVRDNLAAS